MRRALHLICVGATVAMAALAVPRPAQAQLDPLGNIDWCVVSPFAAGATSITVTPTGCGATLPGAAFNISVCNTTDYPSACRTAAATEDPNYEVVRVTAGFGTDTLTITRAQESTADANHNTGGKTYVASTQTAKMFTDINTALGATFLTTSTNSVLNNEAVLTGTANQVILTGSNLSTPQNIHTAATPTFGGETLNGAAIWNNTAGQNIFTAYDASAGAGYVARRARGTSGAPLRAQSGDTITAFNFRTFYAALDTDPATASANIAYVRALTTEAQTVSAQGNRVVIGTTPIGSTTLGERLSIDNLGLSLPTTSAGLFGTTTLNLGVGTTSYAALTSSSLALATNVSATLAGTGQLSHATFLNTRATTGAAHYPGGSATGNANAVIVTNSVNNAGGGGSESNQLTSQMRSNADSVNGYFNPVTRWTATDGTNTGADVGEIGVEGNWSNAGGYTLRRIYLWDFVRNGGLGGSLFRWEDNVQTSFFIGGDDLELHLNIDRGKAVSRYFAASPTGGGLTAQKYRGTVTADLRRALSGDILGLFDAAGGEAVDNVTDATMSTSSAALRFEALADHTTTNHYAKAVLATAASGSTTLTDRLTVDSRGAVLPDGLQVIAGGTAARATTDGTNLFRCINGVAPAGALTNGADLYCASGEYVAMDSGGNAVWLTSLAVSSGGNLGVPGTFTLSGDDQPAQIVAATNDYAISATNAVTVVDADQTRAITGMTGGADGRQHTIINDGTSDSVLILRREDAASTAANRYAMPIDVVLDAAQSATFWYDSTASRWRLLSHTVSATSRRYLPITETDFLGATGAVTLEASLPWDLALLASGTQTKVAGDGVRRGLLRCSSSTTTNSGCAVTADATAYRIAGGEVAEYVLNIDTLTTSTFRFGYLDTAASTDAVDGIYIEVPATGAATCKTSNNSTRTTSATIATLSTATWYRLRVEADNTAANVTCTIFDANGNSLGSQTNSANIPTGAGRETGHGYVLTNSGTTAVSLAQIDYMSAYQRRAIVR